MTENRPALIDTNVLVYALYGDSPRHAACAALIRTAEKDTASLFVTEQILGEFYSALTGKRVSEPFTPSEAKAATLSLLALPGVGVLSALATPLTGSWLGLAEDRDARGPAVFGLQHAALMLASGVRHIYTYNRSDFAHIDGISVLTPAA